MARYRILRLVGGGARESRRGVNGPAAIDASSGAGDDRLARVSDSRFQPGAPESRIGPDERRARNSQPGQQSIYGVATLCAKRVSGATHAAGGKCRGVSEARGAQARGVL